jgi:hypothetical protein
MGCLSASKICGSFSLAFALCALAAGLAVAAHWAERRWQQQSAAVSLDSACQAARRMGWEVQRPFQDADGPAAVLIDRGKNPTASSVLGVGQAGLVYVVETASPEEAQSGLRPCTVRGRLRYFGDPEMIDRFLD